MNNTKPILLILPLIISSTICCMDQNTMNIYQAAKSGNAARVKELILRNPALVNTPGDDRKTPLHFAAISGSEEIALLLIKNNADVDALGMNGTTPLHYAAEYGHINIARLLLQHGAKVNAVDGDLKAPLHKAAVNGHAAMAELLFEHGANPNVCNRGQETPLHVAALNGKTKFIEFLLQHGANVNAVDCYRRTSLHWAVSHPEVARILLQYGADIDVLDLNQSSPLDFGHKIANNPTFSQLLTDWPSYKRNRQRKLLAFLSTQNYPESSASILRTPEYQYIWEEFLRPEWAKDTIEQIHESAERERIYQIWKNNKQQALIKPELALIKK